MIGLHGQIDSIVVGILYVESCVSLIYQFSCLRAFGSAKLIYGSHTENSFLSWERGDAVYTHGSKQLKMV